VGKKAFTLIELVTVVALVAMSLLFLVKSEVLGNGENRQVKAAMALLASSFESARGQAIAGNTYAKIFIDTSSNLKFRRIAIIKQTKNGWITEREILLPDRTFIMELDDLSQCLDNEDLSEYTYPEEEAVLHGETVRGYGFTFTPEGRLSTGTATVLAIGYGTKVGNGINLKKDTNISELMVTIMGSVMILESKSAIKGTI
jgi:prepilin-type N-terminal cleavage/methylation domain-containing protein